MNIINAEDEQSFPSACVGVLRVEQVCTAGVLKRKQAMDFDHVTQNRQSSPRDVWGHAVVHIPFWSALHTALERERRLPPPCCRMERLLFQRACLATAACFQSTHPHTLLKSGTVTVSKRWSEMSMWEVCGV